MIRKKKGQDEDVLLCSSLAKTFQKLKGKTNKRAKMKVMQVLLEFDDDANDDTRVKCLLFC